MKVHLLATITLFAISSSVTAENEAKAKPLYAKVAPACLEILVGGRL
ncbi:MAG: hypothetical protein HOB63_05485, partial [Opitutae bacterium]|nr:hypothetical protein [Opitutae bacterium]